MKNLDSCLNALTFFNFLCFALVDNDLIKTAFYISFSICISANIIVSAINKRG